MYKKKDRIIDVHSGFTKDAMAGLAAKEDYTSVKLKNSCLVNHSGEYPSFSDLMLLHIKGRRYCQVRMVEPRVESLNNGDCFILVTPLHLHHLRRSMGSFDPLQVATPPNFFQRSLARCFKTRW